MNWVEISGFNGNYSVSSTGLIRSNKRKGASEKILKPVRDKGGYLVGCLSLKNKNYNIKYHRVVALAFIDNKENKKQVNHIDGNKENNHIENLEWCTASQNIQHAYDNKLMIVKKGEKHHSSKFSEKNVIKMRKMKADGNKQIDIARLFNVSTSHLSGILNNRYR